MKCITSLVFAGMDSLGKANFLTQTAICKFNCKLYALIKQHAVVEYLLNSRNYFLLKEPIYFECVHQILLSNFIRGDISKEKWDNTTIYKVLATFNLLNINHGLNCSNSYNLAETFREFYQQHRYEIRESLTTKEVQTNEIGRSAIIYFGVQEILKISPYKEFDVIDLGCSIGLNLLFDNIKINYLPNSKFKMASNEFSAGKVDLDINCTIYNTKAHLNTNKYFTIRNRIGLDKKIPNIDNKETLEWLNALIWPSQNKRRDRFKKALTTLNLVDRQLYDIDITIDFLSLTMEKTDKKVPIILLASYVLHQLSDQGLFQLKKQLKKLSFERIVYLLEITIVKGQGWVIISYWTGGRCGYRQNIGRSDPHGEYLIVH